MDSKKNKAPVSLNKKAFCNFIYENRFIGLSFLCSVVIMLLVYVCFSMFPFKENMTILRMDLYHQYGPLFAELRERLLGHGGLIYSWNSGGGSSFIGNFYNYLSSPLSFIVLLFKHEHVPLAIATMILLKAAFASSAFAYYLKAHFNKNDLSIVAFSILYAFSGYFLAYYWNVMWIDAMVFFPFVILGIEYIIKNGKFVVYVVALSLTLITNYYMGYMACIFSVIYFFAFYFGNFSVISKIERSGKTQYRLLVSGIRFLLASIIAGAIAAFSLIPVYFALKSSSATSGTFPAEFNSYFSLFTFILKHFAAMEPTIRSSGNYVVPNIYCGLITVLLVPLYFFSKDINKREKITSIVLLGILLASFNINYLNYIWHGFHFPNDLPYRFSFMYSFVLLMLAYKVFINIKDFSWKQILASGLVSSAVIIIGQQFFLFENGKEIDVSSAADNEFILYPRTIIISLIFIAIYVLVLCFMKNKKFQTIAASVLILCCVISEIAISNTPQYRITQRLTDYAGDYSDFKTLKSNLDEIEESDKYRMELSDLRTRMDPCWYNYNGLSAFSSMAYEKVANLQKDLGMYGNYINSYTYNPQTAIYNSMFSLKYLVKNETKTRINTDLYTYTSSNGKFEAYKNNYCLPIAYCVNNDILDWDLTNANVAFDAELNFFNPFENQSSYFEKASGVSNVLEPLTVETISEDNVDYISYEDINSGYYFYSKSQSGTSASTTLTYPVNKTENVYVYVKSSNVESINVNVGDYYRSQTIKSYPYILDLGTVHAGENVEITIPYENDSGNVYCYVYSLNMNNFKAGYDKLSKNALNVTKFTDTKIEGNVTAENDCVLYTSIPYDKGWQVEIDGKKVSSNNIVSIGDALLGVKISAGSHDVKLHYKVRGLALGICLSVGALITLAIMIVIFKNRKNAFYD